ncbi:MAG: ribbon-helix-helix domain-containing protein [Desulfobacula sp.]|uniref:CopG family transcriptional regulator n=1 Tax=Desulfobacula sp. TaxID=2593537 RepID=UPI0025BFEFE1|nr:CopG family transcriptional regulator [Desulfobacula sp.]MCD4718516.1 ribbon-helix-helix domain-containing protein [Desulfobacula sp.]
MATSVKTAISMQEELFKEVNRLAGELNVSRSKLFVMAVQDYIKKNESQNLLSQINKAFSDHPDSDEIKVHSKMRQKQAKNLEREPW